MAIREIKSKSLQPTSEDVLFNRLGELIEFNDTIGEVFIRDFKRLPGGQKIWDIWNKAPAGELQVFLLFGGTGGGKTFAALEIASRLMLDYPGLHVIGARSTYTEMADSIAMDLKRMWANYEVPFESKDKPPTFWLPNGSQMSMRSATRGDLSGQDKIDKLGGMYAGAAILEEADSLPEIYINTVVARLRQPALPRPIILVVCNPPWSSHWIYKLFFKENPPRVPLGGETFAKGCPCGIVGAHTFHPIKFELEDNFYLPPGYIDNLKRRYQLVPTLYKKFVEGNFGPSAKGNPLFKNYFNVSFHEKPHIPLLENQPIHCGWDFGFRNPAVVFVQEEAETGQIRVIEAEMGERILLDDFAKKVKRFRNAKWPGMEFIDYCDPHGRNRDDRGDKNSIDILKDNGIFPRHKDTAVSYGLSIIAELLMQITPGPQGAPQPAFVVDPTTKAKMISDAMFFGYVQDPKFDEENKPDMLVPYKDGYWDHPMDALRYIMVHLRGDYRSRRGFKPTKRPFRMMEDASDGRYSGDLTTDEPKSKAAYYGFGRNNRGYT